MNKINAKIKVLAKQIYDKNQLSVFLTITLIKVQKKSYQPTYFGGFTPFKRK
jgi:hypothetical protein